MRGRWLVGLGLALVVSLAFPAWDRGRTGVLMVRVRAALRKSDPQAALEPLQRLDCLHPDDKEVHYLLAVAHRRLGHITEAFQYLQWAEELGWPLEDITRQRYMTRFQAGDIKGTAVYLKGLITGGANDEVAGELYESLVKGYLSEFRLHEALVCLNHWIEWRPREIQPRVWRAELWVQVKDWKKAAKEYEGILELEPAHRSARHGLAEAMLSQNRVQEANEQYQQLYAQAPDDPVTWIGLAHCERRLGNLDAANPWLERALQADLQDQLRSYALIEAAQAAIQTRDYPRAIDALKQALALDPENSKAYYSLGTACSRLGRTEQAKEYFGQSRQILDRHRRLKELTDDLVGDPMNAELRYEVATILRQLDRADEAQRWLLTVLHLDPHHKKARAAFVEYSQAQKMHEPPSHGQRRASPAPSKPAKTNAASGK